MPNHVRNIVKFKNLKPGDADFLVNTLATWVERDAEYCMDFDKIIPEPKVEDDCPDDCKVNKDSHVELDADRPWFDWYTWRNKYWNTKWGAYDGYTKIGKSCVTFVFSTAWSPAIPIFRKLPLLGYDIEIRYADEDYGSNCGKLEYNKSEQVWKESPLPNPVDFALRVWNW